MRVLEDNREGWTKEVECKDCHSRLEIDEMDLLRGLFGGNYAERGTHKFYYECPLCYADNTLEDLPRYIIRATEKRVPRP